MNKSGEIGFRQGANRSEVRPRTAEQGSVKPGAGAPRAGMRPGSGMPAHRDKRGLVRTYAVTSPKGPLFRAPVRYTSHDSKKREICNDV